MSASTPGRRSLTVAELELEANGLGAALASGEAEAERRLERSFPKREPSARERAQKRWTMHAARLVVAREQGSPSWGSALSGAGQQESEPVRRFVQAVFAGDVEELRSVLHEAGPELRSWLDAPVFHFDAPAVVQQKNNREVLEVLLDAGADLGARSDWWAGGYGVLDDVPPEQARWLIERGARLDLGAAAALGWRSDVESMLAREPQLVHQRFGDGRCALHCARDVEVAQVLLDYGADIDARCVDHGSTAAQYKVRDDALTRFLVERGAETDVFLLAALGLEPELRALCEAEPNVLEQRVGRAPFGGMSDSWGGTIYQWTLGFNVSPHEVAHARGHRDLYRWLMDESSERVRFVNACLCADRMSLDGLDAPKLRAQLESFELDLFPQAAWNGKLESVRCFLDAGFDPHRAGPEDSTPIDRAAYRGWAEIVEELLERDSTPPLERRNRFGGTPLGACVYGAQTTSDPRSDYVRTTRALVEAGSVVDPAWLPSGVDGLDEILSRGLARRR